MRYLARSIQLSISIDLDRLIDPRIRIALVSVDLHCGFVYAFVLVGRTCPWWAIDSIDWIDWIDSLCLGTFCWRVIATRILAGRFGVATH